MNFFLNFSLLSLGKAVYDEAGELVCLKPFPSMPTKFWNDPQGLKYKKAYFEAFPGEADYTTIALYDITRVLWKTEWVKQGQEYKCTGV